jgi:hypothetical protein
MLPFTTGHVTFTAATAVMARPADAHASVNHQSLPLRDPQAQEVSGQQFIRINTTEVPTVAPVMNDGGSEGIGVKARE